MLQDEMIKLLTLLFFMAMTGGAFATSSDASQNDNIDEQITEITNEINNPEKIPPHAQQSDESLITINTDSLLDMSAKTALDLSGGLPPNEQVKLPFLPNYPINNLEIKLRVLDFRF